MRDLRTENLRILSFLRKMNKRPFARVESEGPCNSLVVSPSLTLLP